MATNHSSREPYIPKSEPLHPFEERWGEQRQILEIPQTCEFLMEATSPLVPGY